MTPEQTHNGGLVATEVVHFDRREILPFCAECDVLVDLDETHFIGLKMPEGDQLLVALCDRCLSSLDAATHEDTLRRLNAIRDKKAA